MTAPSWIFLVFCLVCDCCGRVWRCPPSARSQLSVMPSNLPITVNNCACQRFPSSIERKPRHVRANVHKEMISLTRRGWSQFTAGAGHGIGGDLPCPHFILSDILKSKITFFLPCISTLTSLHIHIQEPQKRALDRESCSSSFPSNWMLKNVLYTVYCTGGTLHLSLVTPESAGIWIIARVSSSPHSASVTSGDKYF